MSQLISNARSTVVGVAMSASRTTDSIATTSKAQVSTFFGGGGDIPDGRGSFQDDIIITDDFRITDVTVTLKNLVHTWVGDLVVRLRHLETETVIDLFMRPGQPHFSSSGYSNDLNGDYSFNENNTCNFEAAAGQNTVIPSGNYTSKGSLCAFHGINANGTWRLTINDCSPGDSGSLGSWRLDLK
ncbi:MAG TPA: hypothetical protein DCP31_23760 [Cyanobacteria bacterium UBA8543]|nr:hypothetical protein [Cyanobacteria bacterium UBA8543]